MEEKKDKLPILILVEAGKDKKGDFIPLYTFKFSEINRLGFSDSYLLDMIKEMESLAKEKIKKRFEIQKNQLKEKELL